MNERYYIKIIYKIDDETCTLLIAPDELLLDLAHVPLVTNGVQISTAGRRINYRGTAGNSTAVSCRHRTMTNYNVDADDPDDNRIL